MRVAGRWKWGSGPAVSLYAEDDRFLADVNEVVDAPFDVHTHAVADTLPAPAEELEGGIGDHERAAPRDEEPGR